MPFNRLKHYAPPDFFVWMDFFFRLEGFLPPKKKLPKLLYIFLSSLKFFATFIVIFLQWITFFLVPKKDFKRAMFILSVAILHSIILFRVLAWFFSVEKISSIKTILSRETFNFKCFGIVKINTDLLFNSAMEIKYKYERPLAYKDYGNLWKDTQLQVSKNPNELDNFRLETMMATRMLCCFLCLTIILICFLTNVLAYLNAVLSPPYVAFNTRLNKNSTYKPYPYETYFPFDTSISDGFYWFGYFYQFYAFMSALLIFLPVETTITNIIIHLISQTSIVREAFKYIDKNLDENQESRCINLIKEVRLVKCIDELQLIYRAIKMLEDVCNVQLLIQYSASVLILCTLCYVIPLMNGVAELLYSSLFLCASLGEIFIFTYCCHTLTLELQNVQQSIYNLEWHNYPPYLRKNIVLLLMRFQKPTSLTAGKIINLDLLFFIQVLQKSYSFYTLISKTNS